MPRLRTGTVTYDNAKRCYVYKLTLNDGSRTPWLPLTPTAKSPIAEARAREVAKEKSEIARREKLTPEHFDMKRRPSKSAPAPGGETVGEYFDRWNAARAATGIGTTVDDRSRWRKWLARHLATKRMTDVTDRDLELVVEALDKAVRTGELRWKTAIHVWSTARKMFGDAHRSKDLALRVRRDNPARDVRGPDRGHTRASSFLFPRELDQLLRCERVP